MIGRSGAKTNESSAPDDAADQVQRDEPLRAHPLFHTRPEEVQAEHVEEDVPQARVQEHVRDDRPRPRQHLTAGRSELLASAPAPSAAGRTSGRSRSDRRWTHGVTRRSPSARRGRRALERFERAVSCSQRRQRLVEPRPQAVQPAPSRCASSTPPAACRAPDRRASRSARHLAFELRHFALPPFGARSCAWRS